MTSSGLLVNVTPTSASPSNSTAGEAFVEFDIRALFICLAVFGLVIVIANGLVFGLVHRQPSLLRKTNYFLISLAVSDMLSGALGIPLVIACSLSWQLMTCTAMDVSNKFLAISTIMHLLSATVERYLKVLAPFRYRTLVTKRRVLLVLAAVWVFSVTAPLIEFTWPATSHQITIVYSLVLLAAFVVFPFLFMNVVIFHIFYIISKQKARLKTLSNRKLVKRKQRRKQAERRAIAVYSIMSASFIVGWFPYFYLSYVSDLIQGSNFDIHPALNAFFMFLKFSTALLDPLLYTFFKTDFQAALKSCVRPRRENPYLNTVQVTSVQSLPSSSEKSGAANQV